MRRSQLIFICIAGVLLCAFGARASEVEPSGRLVFNVDAPRPLACSQIRANTYGTSILWEESPHDAAARAKKEDKPVFVLHVAGEFKQPGMT